MTEFLLTEGFLGGASVDIDENRFAALVRANEVIRTIWDVEDTFALLANSFIELEEYLLSAGIKYYYERQILRNADHFFDDVRQAINLKLVAMLTASRVYEEQVHRRMSALSAMVERNIDVKPSFSAVFDESLEYRVMYALRNHALHNQLPLGMISLGASNLSESGDVRDKEPSRHRVTVDPKISAQEFVKSDRINQARKQEVERLGYQHLDLKFFMRGFIASLANCHEEIRDTTKPHLGEALAVLQQSKNDLQKIKGEEPKHISAVKRLNGRKEEDHYVDYSSKSRLVEIRSTWVGLKWVQRGYVSSEITKSKDSYPEAHPTIWIAK